MFMRAIRGGPTRSSPDAERISDLIGGPLTLGWMLKTLVALLNWVTENMFILYTIL